MNKDLTIQEIYNAVEEASGKGIYFSLISEHYSDLKEEDALKVKDKLISLGFEFKSDTHIHMETYYYEFNYNGIRVDISYHKPRSIDDEIKELKEKLAKLEEERDGKS